MCKAILLYTKKECSYDRKRLESFEYYYLDDLSLSEIAEIMHTSRQGARDNIVRAEKSLLNYEEKLGLKQKNEENDKNISLAISLLDEGRNEEAKRVLENTKF